MYKKFCQLDLIVRIILLLIPVVGWVTEVVIRWEHYLRKQNNFNLVVALIFTFLGLPLQFVDLVINILTGKLILID